MPTALSLLRSNPQSAEALADFLSGKPNNLALILSELPSFAPATLLTMREYLQNSYANSQSLLNKLENLEQTLNPPSRTSWRFFDPELRQEASGRPPLAAATHNVYGFANGCRFIGELVTGKPSGFGTLITAEGSEYTGDFSAGQITGKGILTLANGLQYIGNFVQGKPQGSGICVDNGKIIYSGQWQAGKPHGFGNGLFSTVGSYSGNWLNGAVQEGQGIYTYSYPGGQQNDQSRGRRRGQTIQLAFDMSNYTPSLSGGVPLACAVLSGHSYHVINDIIYVAKWQDGQASGPGIMIYPDGRVYLGELVASSPVGQGIINFAADVSYIGEVRNGHAHGQGVEIIDNKVNYRGLWSDGAKSGYGSGNYATGKYDGSWLNNQPHGKGIYTDSISGTKYIGEFEKGKFHGQGTINFANGESYTGRWENGVQHGYGVYSQSNQVVYKGDFANGRAQGHGVYYFANGAVYSGEFSAGKQHGQGVYTDQTGVVYTGSWRNGQKHGFGTGVYQNGTYDGMWVDDLPQGSGTLYFTDGAQFNGEWVNGLKHGLGTYIFPDQVMLSGLWQNNCNQQVDATLMRDLVTNDLGLAVTSYFVNNYNSPFPAATLQEYREFYQLLLRNKCKICNTGLPRNENEMFSLNIIAAEDVSDDEEVVIIRSKTHHLWIFQIEYLLQGLETGLLAKIKVESCSDPLLNPYTKQKIEAQDFLTDTEAIALKLTMAPDYQT